MPIYEYACAKCGHEFETLVRGGEQPVCARCGDPNLTKLLSIPAAHTGTQSMVPPGCPTDCAAPRGGPGCGMGTCGWE
jgi:putative FmdB family regulatory protein